MKLTKAQQAVLQEAKDKGFASAVDWYQPVQKLLALGLIKPFEGMNSYNNKWVLTEAGENALGKP
jgi:hypothetical protein